MSGVPLLRSPCVARCGSWALAQLGAPAGSVGRPLSVPWLPLLPRPPKVLLVLMSRHWHWIRSLLAHRAKLPCATRIRGGSVEVWETPVARVPSVLPVVLQKEIPVRVRLVMVTTVPMAIVGAAPTTPAALTLTVMDVPGALITTPVTEFAPLSTLI